MAAPDTTTQLAWSLGQMGLGAIGGALFGAVAQIWIASSNRRHAIDQETLKRRQEALERFVVSFESVHRDVVEASVLVSEWQRIDDISKKGLNLREKVGRHFLRLNEGVHALQTEEGHLLLYGLPTAAATLTNYRTLLIKLMPELTVDSVDRDPSGIRKKLLDCADRRIEIYGRMWNSLNGGSDLNVPKAYRADRRN